MYKVEYTLRAIKELKKLDKYTSRLILAWIEKNLVDCDNPRLLGKSLVGDRVDQCRYRVGDYRILAVIEDEIITILIITIGHRKDVYKK